MDSLGAASTLAYGWSPDSSSPLSIAAYLSAFFNAILLIVALSKQCRSRQNGSIYILLASAISTICNIVYFGFETEGGAGFITLNTIYHSLIWLSCISLFPEYAKILKNTDYIPSAAFARIFTYLAFLWFLLSTIVAIVAETMKDEFSSYFNFGSYSISVSAFALLFNFICFNNWAYVLILLILIFNHLAALMNVSSSFKNPMLYFLLLATVAVATDTIIVSAVGNNSIYDISPTAIVIASFIFIHLFNFSACCIILHYSGRWKELLEKIEKVTPLPS